MPTASETRTIAMPAEELWQVIGDPRNLPRWWPRVERVEGVQGAHFTQMLRSPGGKLLRADFEVTKQSEREMRLAWAQQIAGTPFAHAFSAVEVDVELRSRSGVSASAATEVTLTLAQRLKGLFGDALVAGPGALGGSRWSGALGRLGHPMVARAAVKTVKEALDGLERLAC